MFWSLIPLNVMIGAAAVVIGFSSGWLANGWRWAHKVDVMVAAQAQAVLEFTQKSRATEQVLTEQVTQFRDKKDAEIQIVRTQLDAALISLRDRPARSTSVPRAAPLSRAASGPDLSREDSEFLVREAARADEMRAALSACYANYDAARRATAPTNK